MDTIVKRDKGFFRPKTSKNSAINLPICDECGNFPVCEDTASAATVGTVLGFEYVGQNSETTNVLFDTPVAVTDTTVLEKSISEFINAREVDAIVSADYAGGTLSFSHVGAGTITKLVLNTGDLATARKCVVSVQCDFVLTYAGGTASVLKENGTSTTLPSLVYGTNTTTDVTNAIAAALTTDVSVTTTDNVDMGVWIITVVAPAGVELVLDGKGAMQCNCTDVFN